MNRELDDRERELIVFLLENAEGIDEPISAEQRATWLAQVPQLRVGGVCGCGTCPSIDLVTAERPKAAQTREEVEALESRTVLDAGTDGAMVLLFIDDDWPSYLELAPTGDEVFSEFPAVADVRI